MTRISMARSDTTAPPSASVSSQPTWVFRPTRCAWQLKAPSQPTNRLSAKRGSHSIGRSTIPARRSTARRPPHRWTLSADMSSAELRLRLRRDKAASLRGGHFSCHRRSEIQRKDEKRAARHRCPVPFVGPAGSGRKPQRLRRPPLAFRPFRCAFPPIAPAFSPPRRGRDGRGLLKRRFGNEQENSKHADRHLCTHHRQDRRRSGKGRASMGTAVERGQSIGPREPTASSQRTALHRPQCSPSLVGERRQWLQVVHMDDAAPGKRTRRSRAQGRERRDRRLCQPLHQNRTRCGRRRGRARYPIPEGIYSFQLRSDRWPCRSLLQSPRTDRETARAY
uniref:Tiorf61 protein n=1 Tax=Agrobacterium tumefaciens TaxID=358 RepID=Q9R6J8_AGRTU|nr:tiorf61 [Agrobacterium tumefaciens]